MQTHRGISLEGLHWFQVPALHYKDRNCALLWPSVPFTRREWCQKLSLADENCERCEHKRQVVSLEHSAHPLNVHILLYLRDSIFANRSCFHISPSRCLLRLPLSNCYAVFIEAGSFIAWGTLPQPTQHSVLTKEQVNLWLGYKAGMWGPCLEIPVVSAAVRRCVRLCSKTLCAKFLYLTGLWSFNNS